MNLDPKHIWPRIAELAAKYGVKPMQTNDFALLAAADPEGQQYDLEQLISAMKAFYGRENNG